METKDQEINNRAAAAIVIEAEAVAKNLVETAARTAARLSDTTIEEKLTRTLSAALREVFGENEVSGRFVDVQRIPLICKSIIDINEKLTDIVSRMEKSDEKHVSQDQFWPVKTIVYSGVGIVLAAVLTAVIGVVVINYK